MKRQKMGTFREVLWWGKGRQSVFAPLFLYGSHLHALLPDPITTAPYSGTGKGDFRDARFIA